jgi:hypothetical protein
VSKKIDHRAIRAMRNEMVSINERHLPKELNAHFGLPLHKGGQKRVRVYENGPSAASSADRSQFPIAGEGGPNISAANTMTPATGPGGV